jgi:hypothetical protein
MVRWAPSGRSFPSAPRPQTARWGRSLPLDQWVRLDRTDLKAPLVQSDLMVLSGLTVP